MSVIRIKQLTAVFCLLAFAQPGFPIVVSAPVISKSFSAATVGLNNSVTLTFTITNPNGATDLTGVSFNDTMPSGLIISNPDSLTGTCDPGVITPATTSINLVGGTILAGSSCTFSIDVAAISAGTQVNTTDPVTSNEGGTGNTATASVDVTVPDLTITKTHTGNFLRPQTGAVYTITVTNSGLADTSALVIVTDNLPAGMTATSIDGGVNWNCILASLQCSRGDVLTAGSSFETINVTVNVAANAAATVTNTATVSGGGETNTANDTASDPTQITAALALSSQTTNLTVTAGSTATTSLTLTNNGSGLGAITFACSGLPSGASCSFNPASVTTSSQVTMSISTSAKSLTLPLSGPGTVPPLYLALLALLGTTGMALNLTGRRKFRLRFAAGIGCLALLMLAGCGVALNLPGQHSPGTPAGTSAVVVTATSANGGAVATSTVNLTVQ